MTSRRSFLTASLAGGMAFCGCGLAPRARAQSATPARLPVMVAGTRIRTVDVHGHCYFQDAIDLMGADASKVLPPVKGVPQHFLAKPEVMKGRLDEMDNMGLDTQVMSINPFWYDRDRETSAKICEINNSHLAEIHAAHPDRIQGFASLSMQFPDEAVRQLDDAVRKKGLVGAAIGSSMRGESYAAEKFHPVWAKAQELGAVLFIHPQSQPEMAKRYAGNGWLSNVIGNPLDTTICLQHFIFEGMLDKFPTLKILAAHGGGYLPSYAARGDHACFVSPQSCNADIVLKKQPSEYVTQLYFDGMVFTAEGLRHLVATVGASQVVLGTDHPIPWEVHPVDHVMNTTSLSDADKIAILGGNAEKLFKVSV
jgi:aminocarboxymuconate-semialdehyde decarboxylase